MILRWVVSALAEAHHQGIIPHAVPSGPVATAAQVQLGFAVPNWEVQEHQLQDRAPWTRAVKAIVPVVNGHWLPSETPGLGVELEARLLAQLDRDRLRARELDHRFVDREARVRV